VVLPSGAAAITTLQRDGRTLEFLKDQYRHCKPLLALNGADSLLQACGISPTLPTGEPDPGVIVAVTDEADTFDGFVAAIAKHWHFQRETDPPSV
jgi:catalase